MDLKSKIIEELTERNVIQKKESRLVFSVTVKSENKEFELYEIKDEEYVYKEYIHICNVEIEDFGTICHDDEEILEKNINGSNIDIYTEIRNQIRNFKTNVKFYGTYDGDYTQVSVLDYYPFGIEVQIEGIRYKNNMFNEYRDSLGKILDCLDNISEEKEMSAFDEAYTGLEVLIKTIEGIESLTPIQTRDYLTENGFSKKKAKKIRKIRNDMRIHPNKYGFLDQDPDLEEEIGKGLKYVIEAYFHILPY